MITFVTGLEWGDFLVFWLIDDSTFQVAIYDPSGCAKESNPAAFTNCVCNGSVSTSTTVDVKNEDESKEVLEISDSDEREDRESETDGSDKPELHPSFGKVLKKSHKHLMGLPVDFVNETGVGVKEGAVLRNAEGREWSVRLGKWNNGRVNIYWSQFRKENKLKDGDTCFFQLLQSEGNLVHFQVVKRGRKRGRPRLNSNNYTCI